MKKYKICVYAICKNEEKFVDRWYESMKEADEIFVLDTGSIDNTVKLLKRHNIKVKEMDIIPWRFDVARNESLKMIPKSYDICVCTDLDEVLEPGWRIKLESIWQEHTNRLRYIYNWSLDSNNEPIISFLGEKIHSRKNYKWVFPVHEVLQYNCEKEIIETTDNIVINHYPDDTKSRSSYLSLLELSVKENPNSDRNMHYLGREYMFHGMWNESIDTLIHHLSLKSAVWKDERCASMRFIARCYQNLNRIEEAKMWLDKAILEAPYLRDPYVERALLEYKLKSWHDVEYYCLKALEIKTHERTYVNEPFSWDYTIHDLLSINYFNKKEYDKSLYHIKEAILLDPVNERLLQNLKIIENIKE